MNFIENNNIGISSTTIGGVIISLIMRIKEYNPTFLLLVDGVEEYNDASYQLAAHTYEQYVEDALRGSK